MAGHFQPKLLECKKLFAVWQNDLKNEKELKDIEEEHAKEGGGTDDITLQGRRKRSFLEVKMAGAPEHPGASGHPGTHDTTTTTSPGREVKKRQAKKKKRQTSRYKILFFFFSPSPFLSLSSPLLLTPCNLHLLHQLHPPQSSPSFCPPAPILSLFSPFSSSRVLFHFQKSLVQLQQ